jgi:2-polyprenyl-3-methyl-5-hydroxy-6-metoxy-1,4-benzoquinol methylase
MNTDRAKTAWQEVAALQNYHDSSNNILMGPHTGFQYRTDPKHLCFVLSRYKFCSRLLASKARVLEVGCGDAFGTPIVAQAVQGLVAIDWDQQLIDSAADRLSFLTNCRFAQHDIMEKRLDTQFDAIYSIDVLEHVDPAREAVFMNNCCASLADQGVFIAGTPNIKADAYASPSSKLGHINLKDAVGLQELLAEHFQTVLLFSMNDEVVHTGFSNMAHYLFGVGIGVKR